ncbi:MAG: hypothetical protein IH627_00275 [Rubrivivax sp.]|nr:hypothetical protein [Rubrivivax sp.]
MKSSLAWGRLAVLLAFACGGGAAAAFDLQGHRGGRGVAPEDTLVELQRHDVGRLEPTWSPFHGELTEALLAEAHALGLQVIPWAVNDPAQIARLMAWGVDGPISDHPARVRAAVARRGLALPR